MITSIIMLIIFVGIIAVPIMSDVEKLDYKVLQSEHNIEIRLYQPMIIAEVDVEGKRQDTVHDGFRLIADYIFGNNTVQRDIAMTAPVNQQLTGRSWQISLVMPSKQSMESLPQPNNDRVRLTKILSKKFAVIKFSGTNSNENLAEHEKQLMSYIEAKQFKIIGSPQYAFYSPPWSLPFMRRNEVMLEINKQKEILL